MRTMGEMADMAMDDWAMEGLYDTLGDEMGEFDFCWKPSLYRRPKKIPTCKFCGKAPLTWRQVNGKWVLFELEGIFHDCPKHSLPLETLKDIMNQRVMKNEQLLPIPSWDETFMHEVYWWARRSKDPRTKIGAVLVRPGDKDPISHGYNGFSRGVNDDLPLRWERPEKYEWVTHAEENSVLNCARKGQSSKGSIMFTQGIPCTRCADAVVQGGIIEIIVHKQWQDYEKKFGWDKWIDSAKRSEQKFNEAKIPIRVFDGILGMQGVLDGKVINI